VPAVRQKFHLSPCSDFRGQLFKARFAELGGAPMPMAPAAFGALVAGETEKWAKVVKFAGIRPE
jgi:hypothetical protein